MFNKISRFVFSMDFNKYKDNDFILLLNPQDNYIQFMIKKSNNKYNVLKFIPMDQMQKISPQNTKDQINQFLAQQTIQIILKDYSFFVEQYNQFNDIQLEQYFISSEKYKMTPVQFYQLFQFQPKSYNCKKICGVTIFVQEEYNNSIVNQICSFIKNFSDNQILNKGCLVFTVNIEKKA